MIQPANPRSLCPARSSFAPIIGDSVSATTPDTMTAPASVNANSRKSAPVRPPWMPTGAYTAASVMVIAMIGPTSSRAASMAARKGGLPPWMCRSTFSTITIASSTTRPTESTIASSVSRLMVNPAASIRNTAPTSEIGNGDHRDEHRAQRSEEEKDDDDHDEQRLAERGEDLVDRVLDVCGRVVGDARLHAGRHLRLDAGDFRADAPDDVERVGGGQHPDAHEDRRLTVEADVLLVVLRAEHDVGDVAEPDDDAVLLLDDELAELLRRAQVGVGDEVHRHHRSLGAPERREVVVARQRLPQHRGRNAVRRHPVRLEPDAHGEGTVAEDVGALDAADGAQPRLHDANQIVGNLVLIEVGDEKLR